MKILLKKRIGAAIKKYSMHKKIIWRQATYITEKNDHAKELFRFACMGILFRYGLPLCGVVGFVICLLDVKVGMKFFFLKKELGRARRKRGSTGTNGLHISGDI